MATIGTTVAAGAGGEGESSLAGAARSASRSVGQVFADPVTLAIFGAMALGFVGLFWRWFHVQHLHSKDNPDWSHSYVVPLISAWLLWQHRAELSRASVSVFWPGLIPLVLGMYAYLFFTVGTPNHMLQGGSMVLCLFGILLLLLGPRVMEYLFFPIAYLTLGITISQMVMLKFTTPLQHIAAQGAFVALSAVGYTVDLSGVTLTVTGSNGASHPLNVAEACSGMRMVIAFIALGVAVALVACRAWWKRAVLLMMAVPVAVFMNVARVAVLGAATLVDADLAEGEAHTLIGIVLLTVGFGLYMLVLWILNKAVPDDAKAAIPAGAKAAGAKATDGAKAAARGVKA